MSGLDDLTREQLQALVVKLYETVRVQQAGIGELKSTVASGAQRIRELEEEVARLRGAGSSAGLCIRPSVPKEEKRPRKKRKGSFARVTLPATQVVYHVVEDCPECGRKLADGHVKWRHQVMELPQVEVEVTDHLFVERYCGVCGKRFTADPGVVLGDVVVGKKSVGMGLMSLIAHLKTVCRVPIVQIRKLLETLWGVQISAGQIAEILHDVAELGECVYDGLLGDIRGSPVVHADETGWREDGVNGYIWSFSSPAVCYPALFTRRVNSTHTVIPNECEESAFQPTYKADFSTALEMT